MSICFELNTFENEIIVIVEQVPLVKLLFKIQFNGKANLHKFYASC